MAATNDIQQNLIRQVADQVFVKPGWTWLVDETTVRFVFGTLTKIDVAYDAGHDTYTVTVHKLNRKTYEATSETTSLVYAEDLGKFFPARYAKDENAEKAGFLTYDEDERPEGVRASSIDGPPTRVKGSGPGVVRFTDDGWTFVHGLRRSRAERALQKTVRDGK